MITDGLPWITFGLLLDYFRGNGCVKSLFLVEMEGSENVPPFFWKVVWSPRFRLFFYFQFAGGKNQNFFVFIYYEFVFYSNTISW